jgi:hypothetical protein
MRYFGWVLLVFAAVAGAQSYTRGIGVYPGDKKEYMGPSSVVDAGAYRNLALHRPAYQSSAYDYNLTAQLVTDGLVETAEPGWLVTRTSDAGVLGKAEREVFLDSDIASSIEVKPDVKAADGRAWVEFEMAGSREAPELDRLDLWLRKIYGPAPVGGWSYVVSGSDDGAAWRELGRANGADWPRDKDNEPSFVQTIPFTAPAQFHRYRVEMAAAGVAIWGVADLGLFEQGHKVLVGGPGHFSSAWRSAGSGDEWVYVDLGARCSFDRVELDWIRRAAAGELQVSDDAAHWTTVRALTAGTGQEEIRLERPAQGRYVRLLLTKAADEADGYVLSEMRVFGRGGPVAKPQPALGAEADGTLHLARGAWRLQRASLVTGSGEAISQVGYRETEPWMVATVPGTVLTSYRNDGAIADPDFGENQYAISDSFFCADFWYRDEFTAPAKRMADGRYWLDFDGINWKADVYLNGVLVGRIDGGFMRGRFDVTGLVKPGSRNALAVRVIANANPGSTKDKEGRNVNGGALGFDNPTFHASVGWDWISTIRGRNTGIWSDVRLTQTGGVAIEAPLVTSTVPDARPDATGADVAMQATVRNLEAHAVSGVLKASLGSEKVEIPVTLAASEAKTVDLPAVHLKNPNLWWPVGYGEPNLYPVTMTFVAGGEVTDRAAFETGIRQFTYSEDGGVLKIWINGRRLIAKGGNWGFSESMLRYRAREYEAALRYDRDEHFNMIRNWVGQTGDEALYDAADRNGIVIWQDFWLANPWDGPNPDDNALFMANARDYLLRIRNHASLGLFCGRNEGFPPAALDDGLKALVAELVPGLHYIGSSADGPVSGHGPYRVEPLKYYFEHAPVKFHSEIGSPNVPEMTSLARTLPAELQWPMGDSWKLHDFHPKNPFKDAVEQEYGGAETMADWDELAQFVDYNAYRGMFESQSKDRYGLLIWMSHPAWPSLLWQTYDYFFDTDAGYFGAKKAAEPLHIQWNAATDFAEVVNYSAGDRTGLTAHAEVLDLNGAVKWERTATLDSREDSTQTPIKMEFPAGISATHFIRLTLLQGSSVVSRNFYWHSLEGEDFRGIRSLPRFSIEAKTRVRRNGSQWEVETELSNDTNVPELMVRVKVVREKSGDLIVPAIYDDNYIALMPGERRTIHVVVEDADTRGERPRVVVKGYNVGGVLGDARK